MLRSLLRKIVRRLQIESSTPVLRLKRFYPQPSEMKQLAKLLIRRNVSVVLDVGANTGQFAKALRIGGYRGRIVSFEPLSSAHARLTKTARGDRNWLIAPRMAIGSRDSLTEINIAADSVSSSLLAMSEAHLAAAPDSAYVGRETVSLRTLDSLAADYLKSEDVAFLKVDVQGFESQVLAGASRLLCRTIGLAMELSLVPCYCDQVLFAAMIENLQQFGYSLWRLSPGTVDEQTGRQLQADALFFRETMQGPFTVAASCAAEALP